MRIVVFGAGDFGKRLVKYISAYRKEDDVVAVVDNKAKGLLEHLIILEPKMLADLEFEKIIISNSRRNEIEAIRQQLSELQISEEKIVNLMDEKKILHDIYLKICKYDEDTNPRVRWLRNFALFAKERKLTGNVAECGVFQGEFAYYINKFFPEKKLYLFDSFEGFGEQDVEVERRRGEQAFLTSEYNRVGFFRKQASN